MPQGRCLVQRAWRTGLVVLLAAGAAGCLARRPLAEGELDGYWALHEVRFSDAPPAGLDLGGRLLPTQIVLRQEKSLIRSTISIVRAADRLKAGTPRIEIAVSPQYAAFAAQMIARARTSLADLKDVAQADPRTGAEGWARATARVLGGLEELVRLSLIDDEARAAAADEPLGASALPLLELAIAYLDERSGGRLLEDLGPGEAGRLRDALAQVVLRVAFTSAGKQDSPDLREAVVGAMRAAPDPKTLAETLRGPLLAHLAQAPPARPGSGAHTAARAFFSMAPRLLEALETVVRQWDRMDSIAFEFRQGEGAVAAVTLRVAPGREVRIADLFFFQPAIVLKGGTRILVSPRSAGTDEVVIAFEPLEDGAAEVRFEGPGYALVRLLALPLADAALREVRVATSADPGGRSLVSVELLMAAGGDREDPRRILAFQDVRQGRLVRDAFQVRTVTDRLEQIFNYVTPQGRYTYRRVKSPAER